jgi:hypothetical protein
MSEVHTPTIFTSDTLTIYLNDHLAGATAGCELADRAAAENADAPIGAELAELAAELRDDREQLLALIDELHVPVDRAKVALGWTAEKLARLKPNGRLRSYSPLSRLVELEGLLAGVQAKGTLWGALLTAGLWHRERLETLAARARQQLAAVERLQREAATFALGPQAPVG